MFRVVDYLLIVPYTYFFAILFCRIFLSYDSKERRRAHHTKNQKVGSIRNDKKEGTMTKDLNTLGLDEKGDNHKIC